MWLERRFALIACALPWTAVLGCASADGQRGLAAEAVPASLRSAEKLAVFEPRPDGRPVTIAYDFTDAVLTSIVLETGPSLRLRMPWPSPSTGTRIVVRDKSPFRLEGNRVLFNYFQDAHRRAVAECAQSLVRLGQEMDISPLPRNEQLAYWLNLHNVLLIAQLSKHYPVLRPHKLKVGADAKPLFEAPLAELKGVPLSLNDIRLGIVFRFWKDPRVMYGFFTGDVASPKIRARAWRAESLSDDLTINAREFVNALRGVREGRRSQLIVSPLYGAARGSLFPDWPTDLRAHLRAFAKEEVRSVLDRTGPVTLGRREDRTADLIGGYALRPKSPLIATRPFRDGTEALVAGRFDNPSVQAVIQQFKSKKAQLKLRQLKGIVAIEDEPFDAQGAKEVE